MASNTVEDMLRRARDAASEELWHILSTIQTSDLTTTEVIALISLLRPVYERVQQEVEDKKPPVEPIPLKLVREQRNRTAFADV